MTPDEAYLSLHRAGWSIGDTAFDVLEGRRYWLVSGSNGENLIRAEAATRAEAWRLACQQAGAGLRPIQSTLSIRYSSG